MYFLAIHKNYWFIHFFHHSFSRSFGKKQHKTSFIHWVASDEHTKYISPVDFVYSNNFPFKIRQECTKVYNTSIALYKLQNVFLEGTDSRKISSLINSIKYNFIKYIKYDKDEHIYIYTTPRHDFGSVEIFLQTHLINNTYHIIAITIKMRIWRNVLLHCTYLI